MRFLTGVVVGIVIGRPVLSVANEHLTPSVRRTILKAVMAVNDRVNEWVDNQMPVEEEA